MLKLRFLLCSLGIITTLHAAPDEQHLAKIHALHLDHHNAINKLPPMTVGHLQTPPIIIMSPLTPKQETSYFKQLLIYTSLIGASISSIAVAFKIGLGMVGIGGALFACAKIFNTSKGLYNKFHKTLFKSDQPTSPLNTSPSPSFSPTQGNINPQQTLETINAPIIAPPPPLNMQPIQKELKSVDLKKSKKEVKSVTKGIKKEKKKVEEQTGEVTENTETLKKTNEKEQEKLEKLKKARKKIEKILSKADDCSDKLSDTEDHIDNSNFYSKEKEEFFTEALDGTANFMSKTADELEEAVRQDKAQTKLIIKALNKKSRSSRVLDESGDEQDLSIHRTGTMNAS